MIFVDFCTLFLLKFTILTNFRASKKGKMTILELLHSPKLISWKIWVIQKSWNFHTVIMKPIISSFLFHVIVIWVLKKLLTSATFKAESLWPYKDLKLKGEGLLVKKGNKGQISKIHKRFFVSFLLVFEYINAKILSY